MSGQRAQSAVPADHRSAHPKFAGVPWWGAVLLAVTATAIGFAFDAGSASRELSSVFAVCYALGCLAAVLVVRQSGVFTAVIQPPLILFVAVPGAYFLFHGGQLGGLKDLAINCGYPLIERFPLMLFTSAATLLIGLARWYFGLATRGSAEKDAQKSGSRKTAETAAAAGFVAAITSKISGLVLRKPAPRGSGPAEPEPPAPRPRRRAAERPPRRRPAPAEGDDRRTTKRTTPPRARPTRPRLDEFGNPLPERPRRPRPPRAAAEPPPVPPTEARRRVRTQPREPRKQPPPERRGASADAQRRRRFDGYQPFEDPYEPPRSSNGRSTHHPVSRVRYRGDDEDDRAEFRTRPRSSSWE